MSNRKVLDAIKMLDNNGLLQDIRQKIDLQYNEQSVVEDIHTYINDLDRFFDITSAVGGYRELNELSQQIYTYLKYN